MVVEVGANVVELHVSTNAEPLEHIQWTDPGASKHARRRKRTRAKHESATADDLSGLTTSTDECDSFVSFEDQVIGNGLCQDGHTVTSRVEERERPVPPDSVTDI